MFGLDTLDLLIGLVTIYLTFGIVTTALVEAISSFFSLRAKNLESALTVFLRNESQTDGQIVQDFYQHPLIATLKKGRGKPSYIPREMVSRTLLALQSAQKSGQSGEVLLNALIAQAKKDDASELDKLLGQFAQEADSEIERFKEEIEVHFDRVMDRASGWFRRKIQLVTLGVAVVLVFATNLDTIDLVKQLSADKEARAQLVAVAAQKLVQQPQPAKDAGSGSVRSPVDSFNSNAEKLGEVIAELEQSTHSAGLQLGWRQERVERLSLWDTAVFWGYWITKWIGLLVSALAVSLGAPFWFNLLQNLMQVRSSLRPDDKKPTKT